MCLNVITKTFNPPDPKVRTGWKYMERTVDGHLMPMYRRYSGFSKYTTDWQSAHETVIKPNPLSYSEDYISGFHVFPTREEARRAKRILTQIRYDGITIWLKKHGSLALVKVEVRNVTYEGIDGTSYDFIYLDAKIKTLVSKEMRIIGEVRD